MKAVIFDLDETILDRSGSLIDFIQWQVNQILKAEIRNKDDFVKRFIKLRAHFAADLTLYLSQEEKHD